MDGDISKQEITANLESMKQAGIGNLISLEVNVGIPRGRVDFSVLNGFLKELL